MERRPQGERTTSVHGHEEPRKGPLVTPIHQTSTFVLADAEDVDAVYEGRSAGDVYTRYSNPSTAAVEAKLAALERTEAALVSASGMAACATTILAHVGAGGRVVATEDLYGGTINLLRVLQQRFGVRVETVPTTDPEALRAALRRERADLVWLETPTNPTLRLVDIKASAEAAREAGVASAVDSTFASPVNTRPHELGVDLVVHSATKYLGGHSDLSAGAVCGTRGSIQRIGALHRLLGPVLDPHAAFLLERGLRTLPLRVQAANENAQAMAEHLSTHPAVRRVNYPGLPAHPQHALARAQMRGFGGLLSFDLATFEEAKRFVDGLRLVRNAASLGGVESLVSLPVQQSHRRQPPEVLATAGITPGTVRLALGVEDAADLLADVDRALGGLGKR